MALGAELPSGLQGAATTGPGPLPSKDAVDYAHKLGQAGVLWVALAVFAYMIATSRNRRGLLRGLARKHVGGG